MNLGMQYRSFPARRIHMKRYHHQKRLTIASTVERRCDFLPLIGSIAGAAHR